MRRLITLLLFITLNFVFGQTNPQDNCNVNDSLLLKPISDSGGACSEINTSGAIYDSADCDPGLISLWYNFLTDSIATSAIIQTPNGSRIQVFEVSCTNPISPPCKILNSEITIGVSPATLYLVKLDVAPQLNDGNLCVFTFYNTYDWYEIELNVNRIQNPNLNPSGPFFPEELVQFCADIDFTVSPLPPPGGNNCQTIQGIIPSLGDGWEYDENLLSGQSPENFFWLSENLVSTNFRSSNFGIEKSIDGIKRLTYLPQLKAPANSGLPGGYWIISNGNNNYCLNDGDPQNMRGMAFNCDSFPNGVVQKVNFCFTLKVKEFTELVKNNISDLNFSLFVLSDGETGCRMNTTCNNGIPGQFEGKINVSSNDEDLDEIKVYPNPTVQTINIDSKNGKVHSLIFDMFGKELLATSESRIDVSLLKCGIYIIKMNQNDKTKVTKFIKQ